MKTKSVTYFNNNVLKENILTINFSKTFFTKKSFVNIITNCKCIIKAMVKNKRKHKQKFNTWLILDNH